MKKLFIISPFLLSLVACAHLGNSDKMTELYIDKKAPDIQDINFNKSGTLPANVENQSYYNVITSGSAITNCSVFDYGSKKIDEPGKNQIFIGDARDWDIVRIDCRKNHGEGKTGEKYNLEIKVFTDGTTYYASTEVVHG
ncbi:hypothetical protein [Francisella philomiragia]|uniref:Lipoprotein n=1 Tax=Francisella philomiragia TaxID=28110 RepID=A0A0B6CXD0_9GAMM|nr:hypothetical protein [Francisella philomiragia]AJI53490.1 hypothetical protein LA55_1439 [Francisella philomiragia]MBY7733913.1 hypothetical protein [Francisella philomiragia]